MRPVSLHSSPVPSPAVLRYLKIQADSLRFFSEQKCAHPARNAFESRRTYYTSPWRGSTTPSGPRQSTSLHPPAHRRQPFHSTSALLSPREVARRPDPFSKWRLTPPSSPSPLSSLLDDSASLGSRLSKPIPDQRLRCTEFDEHGNVTVVNGEFRKSELIQKYGLQPRDLRKIDSSLLPNILVRQKSILMNLLHIRCLIQADRVLVFDAYGSTDSYTQSLFMYDLEGKLSLREGKGKGELPLPYEFRALEAVLISVTSALESEFEGVRGPVVKVLRELEENIDRDKLRLLLVLSKKLGTFEQRARLVRDAIDELLEADDDLASMYLSEKREGRERSEEDHTEVEMLLESYDKVCDEIVQVSGNLVSNIRNTEEIVKAILDANRNSLMLLDLKFSIGTLGIGAGTFVAALYGMNLKSFIEEWDFGFPLVSLTCAIFTAIACVYGLRKLRRVQRLSMWGEGDLSDRGIREGRRSWRGGEDEVHNNGPGSWREVEPVAEQVRKMEEAEWKRAEKAMKIKAGLGDEYAAEQAWAKKSGEVSVKL
ncbi:Mitochondrial inner membrane magnesium transporter mrs2-like protein [Elsinoe fawcettii]|nr:Mitochondrial inner membrane magnesium transporter mrs2-like protein [Elsinoe fawcettii]